MKLRLVICLLGLAFSSLASSADVKSREFEMQVSFGDHLSSFKIWSDSKGRHYSVLSASANPKTGPLSEKDFQFYLDLAKKAQIEKSEDISQCPRNQFLLITQEKNGKSNWVGCIGSKTAISKKLTSLANALDLLR